MDCATFQDQLPTVMVHRENDGARTALAEHATGCLSCRRTLTEWEAAQRALETALGATKPDRRHLKSMVETLYAEQFGTAMELKLPPRVTTSLPNLLVPLLLGAAGGLVAGYLLWGSASSGNLVEQIMLQQIIGSGQVGRGPMARLPGMIGSAGSVVRDLFGICVIIWLSRSRLWEFIFPTALPRGIQMARLLAIPLVLVGSLKVIGSVLWGPSAMMLAGGSGGFLGGMPILMDSGGWLVIDAGWRYGFWLLLFLILFTLIENLGLQYLRAQAPEPRRSPSSGSPITSTSDRTTPARE